MNAPEKIYYNPSFQDYWKEERESAEDVEYIRKDIVDDMLKTAEDHAYFAGSEAMREKMMTKALPAVVSQVPLINEIVFRNPPSKSAYEYNLPYKMNMLGLNKGDEVKLIVIKDE